MLYLFSLGPLMLNSFLWLWNFVTVFCLWPCCYSCSESMLGNSLASFLVFLFLSTAGSVTPSISNTAASLSRCTSALSGALLLNSSSTPDTLNTAPFHFQFQFPFSLLPFANSFAYLYFPSVFKFLILSLKAFTMATCLHLSPHFPHFPTLLYLLYSSQLVKSHSAMHR